MSSILHHHAPPGRGTALRTAVGWAAVSLAVPLFAVTACGSSPASPRASSTILGSALQQDCTNVADVLSDGPDPDADSVGYAQAQVLPLRQLTIGDAALHADVLALANAYEEFSSSDGAATAAAQVAKAENAVNSICPQAAP